MGFASIDYAERPLSAALPAAVAKAIAEPSRRAVLSGLGARVGSSDADFDRLTQLASSLCDGSAALINLIDVDRQWSISSVGAPTGGSPLVFLLCALTISAADGTLAIGDTRKNVRLRTPEMQSSIRSCVGAALVVNGARIGALLVVRHQPKREVEADVLARLKDIAALASSLLTLKDSSHRGDLAAAALTRVEKRHELALEAATIASWIWDVRSGMVECDALLPEFFNLPPATRLRARQLFFAMDRRDLRRTAGALDTILDSNDDYSGEYRVKGTSPPRLLSTR
jgi:GAF domain-containing protein